jgi:4-alpha-glucanotransferase
MKRPRQSGVLLHPTQLPGRFGRGDLGPAAHAFVQQLAAAGQTYWQILPLGPPDCHGSPYAAMSAFAMDPLLASLELLVDDGLLEAADLAGATFPEGRIVPQAQAAREKLLDKAYQAFKRDAGPEETSELEHFRAAHAYWLEDHALFVALRGALGAPYWERWPDRLRRHLPGAVAEARAKHQAAIDAEVFRQYLVHDHWGRLRAEAHQAGVRIFGDVPIFVARDSSDVWARPELFFLDGQGEPTVVAGVPPDLFTEDGQLWGNPLFDWAIHARTGWAWWIERVRHTLSLVDLLRIDHFRGFAGYWEIPGDAKTARGGRWVPGPRGALFEAIKAELGELPIVAEDLGVVTEDVTALLESTGFPGMKVLQFAFDGDPLNPFLPENVSEGNTIYPGTHDNDTTAGWFAKETSKTKALVTARVGHDPVQGLIDLALKSPAFLAVIPVQDLLGLGTEARTNEPGSVAASNWSWRLGPGQLTPAVLERLRAATARHGRLAK